MIVPLEMFSVEVAILKLRNEMFVRVNATAPELSARLVPMMIAGNAAVLRVEYAVGTVLRSPKSIGLTSIEILLDSNAPPDER